MSEIPAINRLRTLFLANGEADYIGEPLSVLAHSLQAAEIVRERGGSTSLQLAALLHDIGHLLGLEAGFAPAMDGCGTPRHEHVAADFLRALGCQTRSQRRCGRPRSRTAAGSATWTRSATSAPALPSTWRA